MIPLVILRHGPTAWTEAGRIQGRADVPLSPAGRDAVAGWRLPADFSAFAWASSPLARARETAAILGAAPDIEPALIEMDWGDWEGRTLAELRAALGPAMAENEARGIDFRPAGGESPREVQARLGPWLAARAAAGRATAAVSHKGVIRALLALATGWDMTGESPAKLRSASAHLFVLGADGEPRAERINIALEIST